MDNKRFLYIGIGAFVLLLIILLVAATSCGGGSKKKTKEDQTLTIWNLFDDEKEFEQVIKNFQRTNKNVKIVYEKKDPGSYLEDSLNEIAAGEGPDVWAVPNDWMAKYHDKMVPMPDGKMKSKKKKKDDIEMYRSTFPESVAQDNIIDNKIYGIPIALDTLTLYYNPAIFREALKKYTSGPVNDESRRARELLTEDIKNWDDFAETVRLINGAWGPAVAMGTADNVNQSVDILTLLMMQNGAKMTSEDRSTAEFHTYLNRFNGPEYPGTQALEFYTSFAREGSENKTWSNDMPDSVHAFAEEKVAMMIDYASRKEDVKRINSDLNFQTMPVPQIKETQNPLNYANYLNYTVTKASKSPTLAWNFVLSLKDTKVQSTYPQKQGLTAASLDQIGNSKSDNAVAAKTSQSWYKPDPDRSDFVFEQMIKQVLEGTNPQTAIEGAASSVITLLQELKES